MADSFHIDRGSNNPKYRIEEISKDRPTDEPSKHELPPPPRHPFIVAMAFILKKILDLFEGSTERGLSASAEISCREHLLRLKKAFELLQQEDRSKDASFLNQLSHLWNQILEDAMLFRRTTPVAEELRSFIKELQHYPKGQEYTLGYYLSEYAGQKWLPFPYMEMIYRLQIQHNHHPNESYLLKWTKELETMARMLED